MGSRAEGPKSAAQQSQYSDRPDDDACCRRSLPGTGLYLLVCWRAAHLDRPLSTATQLPATRSTVLPTRTPASDAARKTPCSTRPPSVDGDERTCGDGLEKESKGRSLLEDAARAPSGRCRN